MQVSIIWRITLFFVVIGSGLDGQQRRVARLGCLNVGNAWNYQA